MSLINRVKIGSVVEYYKTIQPLTIAFWLQRFSLIALVGFSGLLEGIPVRHHGYLLALHHLRLTVYELLSPLYGLRTSRYRRGYAFTRTLSRRGLSPLSTSSCHGLWSQANYPSNLCSRLISAKRIALCINPRKGGF